MITASSNRSRAVVIWRRSRTNKHSSDFSMPLRPQRQLELVIEASGGRQGHEPIGVISADAAGPGVITLNARGSSLLDTDSPVSADQNVSQDRD